MRGRTVLLLWIIPMILLGVSFDGDVSIYKEWKYPIQKAIKHAYTAENTSNRSLIAERMQNCYDEIGDFNGNYAWWFPTEETNFDSIKVSIQSVIYECQHGNITDWQLTNIFAMIENIIYDLDICKGITPIHFTYTIWTWIFFFVSGAGVGIAWFIVADNCDEW